LDDLAEPSISETEVVAMLQKWQQGDIFELPQLSFIYVADGKLPLTDAAKEQAREELSNGSDLSDLMLVETAEQRFVVITQSCDIVKHPARVPTVQIAPIIAIDSSRFSNAKRGESSRFLYLPALDQEMCVADLDRIMTVEKALLVKSIDTRKKAVNSDQELKKLGDAIGSKFSRFAFPNDYNESLEELRRRVVKKHNRNSEEGVHYRNVSEIRVVAEQDWSSDLVFTTLIFMVEDEKIINEKFRNCIGELVKLVKTGERFPVLPEFRCVAYKNLDADTYRRSFPLDLEYLSN
jgi:hypothetical protein